MLGSAEKCVTLGGVSWMFQLIVNADTKFACKIMATFSTLLERILQILSLLKHNFVFHIAHSPANYPANSPANSPDSSPANSPFLTVSSQSVPSQIVTSLSATSEPVTSSNSPSMSLDVEPVGVVQTFQSKNMKT